MYQRLMKEKTTFLPKRKELVVDAEYEFIDSSPEEQKVLIESITRTLQRIKDATRPTSIS